MGWLGEAVAIALVVGIAATVLSGLARLVRSRGRSADLGSAVLDGGLVASVAAVLVATLSPFDRFLTWDGRPVVQLAPLERLDGAPVEFAVINLLLLVPTIVLLALRWRRAGLVALCLVGLLLSVGIEGAQLLHPLRGTNVDDVILNTLGAAGGAVVGVTLRWALARRRGGTPPRVETSARSPLEPSR